MAFILYFFVLMFSAATVLFGLDLMTAPLPTAPNVPIGRSVRHVEKPAVHDANEERMKARLDDRKLSPIYPASPPGPKTDTATIVSDTADGSSTTASQDDAQTPAEQLQTQAEIQPTQNRCDVRACSDAYVSFRASDCTYQPYEGPRRLCEKSDGATATATATNVPAASTQDRPEPKAEDDSSSDDWATARADRQTGREDENSDAARIVRQMTRGQGEADIPVLSADGRIIIVHTSGARAQASARCNVAACARAYSTFNASDCTYQPYDGSRRICRR